MRDARAVDAGLLRLAAAAALALSVAGCAMLPDKPVRPVQYDLGAAPAAAAAAAPVHLAPVVLPEVEAGGTLEGSAMLYRLGYADAHQLRPYAYARWSASPAQLVRQRLREVLGQQRAVLDTTTAATLAREAGRPVRILRVELDDFSHLFESTTQSTGVVRLRGTVLEYTPAGERLLAQRAFAVQRPAPTPDAAGGVRALAAATDAVAAQVAEWLAAQR